MTDIASITEREVGLIARFIDLLNEEQAALKRADAIPLPKIAEQKTELTDALNMLEAMRRSMLGVTAEQKTREAMNHWLLANPQQKDVAKNWEKLLELATKAKELHTLNAQLISTQLQQANEALIILTQHAAKELLYDSEGQKTPSTGSRIIDSA